MKNNILSALLIFASVFSFKVHASKLCSQLLNSPATYSSTLIRDLRKAHVDKSITNENILLALKEQVRWNLQLQEKYGSSDAGRATINANILVALDMIHRMSKVEGDEILKSFILETLAGNSRLEHVHFDNGLMQFEMKAAVQGMKNAKNIAAVMTYFRVITEGFAIGVLNYGSERHEFADLGVRIRFSGDLILRYDVQDL